MKAIALSIAFEIARSVALAQDAPDPMAHLRACAVLEPAARLECLDKLSRSIAPAQLPARGEDNWVVSETTSPIDYTPIVTATTFARGASQNSLTRLTIYCRGGRTERNRIGGGFSAPRSLKQPTPNSKRGATRGEGQTATRRVAVH